MRNISKKGPHRWVRCVIPTGWGLALLLGCGSPKTVPGDTLRSRPDVWVNAVTETTDGDITRDSTVTWESDNLSPEDGYTPSKDTLGGGDALDGDTVEPDEWTASEPTLYPSERLLSPMSPNVIHNLREIVTSTDGLQPNVFMKVGASSTVSNANLFCFAGDDVELDTYADLEPTIDFFLGGDAAGTTPFDRASLAAKVGMSAGWVLEGFPSPLESEIQAIQPRFAFVHYGTNDKGLGATYASALWKFGDRMMELSGVLIERGIVPILLTIAARGDKPDANRWVATYNAVIRAIAQGLQIPLLDLHFALKTLDGFGLSGDGIHLNTYKKNGSNRPCVFTSEALGYGMNMRNVSSLIALDALHWTVVLQEDMFDESVPLAGEGSLQKPFAVVSLPFSDRRSTLQGGESNLDTYTGCDAPQDESGPEFVYRFTTSETRSIRALVLDQGEVDVDIHLLDSSASESGCLLRDHQLLEATLAPGTYHFVVDTYVQNGQNMGGDYHFVLLDCDKDDPSCSSVLLEDAP